MENETETAVETRLGPISLIATVVKLEMAETEFEDVELVDEETGEPIDAFSIPTVRVTLVADQGLGEYNAQPPTASGSLELVILTDTDTDNNLFRLGGKHTITISQYETDMEVAE